MLHKRESTFKKREVHSICALCAQAAHIGMIKRREELTLYACFLRGSGCRSVSGAVSCGQEREWSMTQCMAINTHKPLSHALVSGLAHGKSPDYPQVWADMAGKHPLPGPRNAIKADQVYYTSMQACMPLNMPHCHTSTASHSHCSISLYASLHAIITQLTAPDLPWCSNSLAWALRPAFLMACSNTSHVAPSPSRQEQRMRKKASLTSCLWLSTSMSTVVVVMFRYVHNALH